MGRTIMGGVCLAVIAVAGTQSASVAGRVEPRDEYQRCVTITYHEKVELDGWQDPAEDGDGRYEWYVEYSDGSTWLHVNKDRVFNRLTKKNRNCNMIPRPQVWWAPPAR